MLITAHEGVDYVGKIVKIPNVRTVFEAATACTLTVPCVINLRAIKAVEEILTWKIKNAVAVEKKTRPAEAITVQKLAKTARKL